MAKGKSNDLLPTLGGVFSLFVVFLKCLGILGSRFLIFRLPQRRTLGGDGIQVMNFRHF